MKRDLSQQEIDAVFRGSSDASPETKSAVAAFDFSRLDRIPKSQIRAVHLLHENFAKNLASSLSAYLRAYVTMNLVSLEQISYAEFLEGFSPPTFIAYIGLQPYDGSAVMEVSPDLVSTFVEMLLGGGGKSIVKLSRKISEIEKRLMQNLLRIVLQNLSDAWKSVADIRFAVQSLADEPQVLHVLAPAEAVVAIAIEARVGPTTAMINFAIPSIFIKRLRHSFEQLRLVHRAESKRSDQVHMADLLRGVGMNLEVRLDGPTISTRDLLSLEPGSVLLLDYPVERRAKALLNGQPTYWVQMTVEGAKLACKIISDHEQIP
ncbi:MAG TPA: FliM/FliN family flagellar motor switch protein [Bryobacteraceae bacterium]|jgi:flagellar motor switch protein FliM